MQVLYLPRENERIAIKTPSSIKFYDLKEFKLMNEVLLTENKNSMYCFVYQSKDERYFLFLMTLKMKTNK